MSNYNQVILMGNLCNDPQVRYTPKGSAVCQLNIAVNRNWKNEAGEPQGEVTFVSCTAFSKTAEVIAQYLKKGNPIFINGRLKLDQWEDKNTKQKQSRLSVVIEGFQFIGGNSQKADSAPAAPRATPPPLPMPASKEEPLTDPAEDDVPF